MPHGVGRQILDPLPYCPEFFVFLIREELVRRLQYEFFYQNIAIAQK